MARLLALTDRLPSDSDWKGALTWRIILALAESHHDVTVLTTQDLDQISLTHPRLTVTRPVTSWRVDQMHQIAKVLIRFQPQIIHVFAPKQNRLWAALEAWPYLTGLDKVLPALRSFSTLFERADWQPGNSSLIWHKEASHVTVFTEQQQMEARQALGRPVHVLPLDLGEAPEHSVDAGHSVLVPAAVSEWRRPEQDLHRLADFLDRHIELSIKILGGWGDWPQSQRRQGWSILQAVSDRVHLAHATDFDGLLNELDTVSALWLEPVPRESWRFLLASRLAEHMGKRAILSTPEAIAVQSGSTANSLSRLYSQP